MVSIMRTIRWLRTIDSAAGTSLHFSLVLQPVEIKRIMVRVYAVGCWIRALFVLRLRTAGDQQSGEIVRVNESNQIII